MSDIDLIHSIRGTSDLPGVAERVWFMWKTFEEQDDNGTTFKVAMRNVKAREGDRHAPLAITIKDTEDDTIQLVAESHNKTKRQIEVEGIFKEILFPSRRLLRAELIPLLAPKGLPRYTAYKWIPRLVRCGCLKEDADGRLEYAE